MGIHINDDIGQGRGWEALQRDRVLRPGALHQVIGVRFSSWCAHSHKFETQVKYS